MDILITGANRGIGLSLTKQALAAGHHVIATAREPKAATELAALKGVEVLPLSVEDGASVEALAKKLRGRSIDVLINNAGTYGEHQSVGDLDFQEAGLVYAVNALGPLRVTLALLDNLRAGQGKRVANISSMMGSIADNSSGGEYGYRMSKAALNMASKTLANDLARDGIRVVALNPGWVQTDMGGPNAPTPVDEAARGILQRVLGLSAQDNGQFVDYRGGYRPW
ncbi:MAG: SDR family oxidoreductase [Myxococcota bacterium]